MKKIDISYTVKYFLEVFSCIDLPTCLLQGTYFTMLKIKLILKSFSALNCLHAFYRVFISLYTKKKISLKSFPALICLHLFYRVYKYTIYKEKKNFEVFFVFIYAVACHSLQTGRRWKAANFCRRSVG